MLKLVNKKRSGFTLIEMVFVIFIISLLLFIIIPNISSQKKNATDKTDQAFISTLQTQVDIFNDDNPSLEELKKDGYISDSQYKHANDKGIEIKGGKVEHTQK